MAINKTIGKLAQKFGDQRTFSVTPIYTCDVFGMEETPHSLVFSLDKESRPFIPERISRS